MKKFLNVLPVIAIIAFIVILAGCSTQGQNMGKNFYDSYSLGSTRIEPTDSTSTDIWVSSASITASTKNAVDAKLLIDFAASSTASVLNWSYYFSDDATAWYGEDDITDTSNILMTHGSSTQVHTIAPQTTARFYKYVDVGDIDTDYFKVTFDVDTASGTLDAKLITEQQSN